jgi:hypothetical protein
MEMVKQCHVCGIIFLLAGVERSPLILRPHIGLLYQPWMAGDDDYDYDDGDDCGPVGGINDRRGNRSTQTKYVSVLPWLPQVPGLEPRLWS